jgi:hypothetical protein
MKKIVLALLCVLLPSTTFATTYYVDGSCAQNGNGLADQCATSAGGAGAWKDPATGFATAAAGDTVLVKNGVYVTLNMGTDTRENGGFAVVHSGTAANPVVIKAYPGHTPTLANCAIGSTQYAQCNRPTVTASTRSYWQIEGFKIVGGLWIFGASPNIGQGSPGIVIRGNEITQGWGQPDDGNWGGIFIQDVDHAVLDHNNIHDISVLTGGGQQSSGSCIKMYENTGTIVEFNTCKNVPIGESQAGGIDDKAQAWQNIHRFNWIERVNTCIRINNQLNSSGVQVYGNVCIANTFTERPGIRAIDNIDGLTVYNNTFMGFAQGLQIMNEGGPIRNIKWYNNISVTQLPAIAGVSFNVEAYQAAVIAPTNYNAWTSGLSYKYGGLNNTLAQWKALGFDANGVEVDCQVSSTTGKLAAGSACIGAGRVGGVSSGAAVDRGAFGVTACVGHTCGVTQTPIAPVAPAVVNIK